MTMTAPQIDPTAAHVFTAKNGLSYQMRSKRTDLLVTQKQFADHYRNLGSAFTGTLEDRCGYRDLYQLEPLDTDLIDPATLETPALEAAIVSARRDSDTDPRLMAWADAAAELLEDRRRMEDLRDGLSEAGDLRPCQFEEFEGRAF